MPVVPLFYIRNTRSVVGNCALWWCEGGHGYTCDLKLAWKVPLERAIDICRSRPEQDTYLPCEAVESIAELHVDSQKLPLRGHRFKVVKREAVTA
jgi:hypothetical protein